MRGSKRQAIDICDQIKRENIIAALSEHVSADTTRAAMKMQNTTLAEQIEAHRIGGSD